MVIELKHIKKVYDKNGIEVVKDFNLTINDKEFIVFVGPSGCGKSTTLRMIAGLESITAGELLFDGKVVNNLLPGDRNLAMVFQSYALYPNMTVYKNMEFPLNIKKFPNVPGKKVSRKEAKEAREKRIKEVAEMLGLTEYLDRKPKALSGGQRQRVAVGREIVRDVDLFLMDEPLSNLDAKLRVQMRTEITNLHRRLQKTFIYVTHDQIEAMTMATRIVIMNDGIVQQIGTPKEVYDMPENMFVAGFIGTPAMNFINGKVTKDGYFTNEDIKIKLNDDKFEILKKNEYVDKEVVLGIRPENITADNLEDNERVATIMVENAELLGFEYNLIFHVAGSQVISRIKAANIINPNQNVKLHFDLEKTHFFDPKTTIRIR